MLTTLRSIGNSKGVLIPSAFLASCKIEGQVDMELQDGQIVIRPVTRAVRQGWFAQGAAKPVSSQEAQAEQGWAEAPLSDDDEWVW
jgi:antitoxin MazE